MDKLTLDTNTLRDWAWSEGIGNEYRYGGSEIMRAQVSRLFAQLKALRDNGMCEIGVTTQLYTDYDGTSGRLPEHIQQMLGTYVKIATPALFMFPLVLPFAGAGENSPEEIFRVVFPLSRRGQRKYESNHKDALQLCAHKVAGRDFFITTDRAILRKKAALAQQFGIEVRSVDEYVAQNPSQTDVVAT
jgi:hypothetical protein